jgi:hypothetical protein
MDFALVIIGFLIFAAILKNKDLRDEDKYKDVGTFLTIFVLFLIFGGLGFLLPMPRLNHPNYSLLIPMQIGFAAVAVSQKGMVKTMATIGAVAVLVYLIFGSFM